MKARKNLKLLGQALLVFMITSCLMLALNIIAYGMPVFGGPKPQQVARVVVEDVEAGDIKELTGPEDIELACKLVNFLNYVPFAAPDERISPIIKITYTLNDGRELTASANYGTGWWGGKPYALKDDAAFVNITRGVCFPTWREIVPGPALTALK